MAVLWIYAIANEIVNVLQVRFLEEIFERVKCVLTDNWSCISHH